MLRLTYGIRPIERTLPSSAEEKTRREVERLNLVREGRSADESALFGARASNWRTAWLVWPIDRSCITSPSTTSVTITPDPSQ